jgi:NADH:ubiquinone oxidoreductase subunit 5 (subunit L)/multisubunit Na+/H+ antiporter MnhA subunit
MTTPFSHLSWLIVVLPVLAFVLIALAIIVAGQAQRFSRAVAPWIIIACLAGALVIAGGALYETLQTSKQAQVEQKADDNGDVSHVAEAVAPAPTYDHSVDWMAPEPATVRESGSVVTNDTKIDRTLKVGVLIDPLSALMLVVVVLVSLLVQIYSYGYMKKEEHPRFYLYMSLFTASMLGLVISSSLLQLFIFWELVGLCSYLLIGFWYQKPEAARAAIKALPASGRDRSHRRR